MAVRLPCCRSKPHLAAFVYGPPGFHVARAQDTSWALRERGTPVLPIRSGCAMFCSLRLMGARSVHTVTGGPVGALSPVDGCVPKFQNVWRRCKSAWRCALSSAWHRLRDRNVSKIAFYVSANRRPPLVQRDGL